MKKVVVNSILVMVFVLRGYFQEKKEWKALKTDSKDNSK